MKDYGKSMETKINKKSIVYPELQNSFLEKDAYLKLKDFLQNHFDSKESILIDVLNRGIENVENEVRMRINLLPSNSTFKDKLKTAIEGHLAGMLSNGDYTSANIKIYSQIPLKAKERHKVVRRAYADYWNSLFEEAFDNGELREALNKNVFRLFVLGSLNWTTEWYDPKRGSFKELVDQVTSILFFGIFKK